MSTQYCKLIFRSVGIHGSRHGRARLGKVVPRGDSIALQAPPRQAMHTENCNREDATWSHFPDGGETVQGMWKRKILCVVGGIVSGFFDICVSFVRIYGK